MIFAVESILPAEVVERVDVNLNTGVVSVSSIPIDEPAEVASVTFKVATAGYTHQDSVVSEFMLGHCAKTLSVRDNFLYEPSVITLYRETEPWFVWPLKIYTRGEGDRCSGTYKADVDGTVIEFTESNSIQLSDYTKKYMQFNIAQKQFDDLSFSI